MKISKSMEQLKLILPIVFGTAIYAFGLLYFIIPSKLMEGGITGITLLLNYAFSISPSLSTLFLNIPLFLIGWKMLGASRLYIRGSVLGRSHSFCGCLKK